MLYLTVGALAFQHHHRLPLKFGVEQSPTARAAADVQMVAILKTTGGSERLLAGRKPLIQPHANRPKVNDMLTGLPVEAYNDNLGRELPSVDLTQTFSMEDIATLHQASDDAGGILVFTNQNPEMTIHDHVRFARQLDDYCTSLGHGSGVELSVAEPAFPEVPEVLEIVREADARVVFGENWHSDHSFHEETCSFSLLRGVEVPVPCGINDTLFSSTADAFDALSPTMQNLLLDLNVYHSANRAYGKGHSGNSLAAMTHTKSMILRDDLDIVKYDVLHPLVVKHPTTGRHTLFASPTFSTHIDGMADAESKAILQFVYEWTAKPEFCTRVSWQPNQVVMWDNRLLSHKGIADDVAQRRVMHRVSLRGSRPYNHNKVSFSQDHKAKPAAAGLF